MKRFMWFMMGLFLFLGTNCNGATLMQVPPEYMLENATVELTLSGEVDGQGIVGYEDGDAVRVVFNVDFNERGYILNSQGNVSAIGFEPEVDYECYLTELIKGPKLGAKDDGAYHFMYSYTYLPTGRSYVTIGDNVERVFLYSNTPLKLWAIGDVVNGSSYLYENNNYSFMRLNLVVSDIKFKEK